MKKIIYVIVSIILLSTLFITSANADLGNFNNYSSGSGSSSGSSSSHSSGGSVYYGGGGGIASGGDFFISIITVAIIFVVSYYISKVKKNGNNNGNSRNINGNQTRQIILPDNTMPITEAITAIDPLYSKEKFLGWVKEVFFTLQTAWSERDWEKVRPFEKEELYKQHEMQIKEYINNGKINVLERINVSNAYLYKYERDAEYEHLSVLIQARMVDYIKSESTGQILKGNPNIDCYMQYVYTFTRKTGVLTGDAKSENSIIACPHCGAPTKITSAGECEYCGYIITTGEFSWVLSDIEAVSPNMTTTSGGVYINDNK